MDKISSELREVEEIRIEDDSLTQKSTNATTNSGYRTSFKTWIVVLILGLGWSTATLANVGPGTTSSYVAKSLNGAASASWIPNAALFPLIGLQPLWGASADRFGKKWFMVCGGLIGVVGNIVAARADNVNQVIVGQAINGVGSSLILLVIPTSLEIVPAAKRPVVQGVISILNGIFAIVGLLESGGFAQMSPTGWRWVFYFNAIFFGITGLLLTIFYSPPPPKLRRENSVVSEIKSFDFIGMTLFLCGIIGVVVALTWGGNSYPWSSSRVIVMLVLGICFLIVFGCFETWCKTDGLLDHRFLESRNFMLILSVGFVDGMLLYGVNVFFPVEVEAIFTNNLLLAGVYLLPMNVAVLVGCFFSAWFLQKTHRYRSVLITALIIIALFLGLLALVTPSRLAIACTFTGLVGLGVGVTTVLPPTILSYSIPSHLFGTGGTLLASTRALGGTVGITIFSTIYGNKMKTDLPDSVAKAAIAAGLPAKSVAEFLGAFLGSVGNVMDVSGVTPKIIEAAASASVDTSARSFRYVWYANMAIALATAAVCAFLRPVAEEMTEHVESALEVSDLRTEQMQKVKVVDG